MEYVGIAMSFKLVTEADPKGYEKVNPKCMKLILEVSSWEETIK